MLKKIKLISSIVLLSTLVGCASGYHVGKPLSDPLPPTDPDKLVKAQLESVLRNPLDFQMKRLNEPVKYGKVVHKKLFENETLFGYVACYEVNAKNRFGAFVGERLYLYMFDGDKIKYYEYQDPLNLVKSAEIYQECKKIRGEPMIG